MWRIPRCTQNKAYITYSSDTDNGGKYAHADAPCVFGMERRANGETLLALCNFADSEQKFTASLPKFTILLDSNAAEFGGTRETLAVSRKDSLCTVALPRYSAVLLKL